MDNSIIISQPDFEKLTSLLRDAASHRLELLEEELSRASVVPVDLYPKDAVSMNSEVTFMDQTTGKESTVTLVFPQEANAELGRISILAPVGMALIGLRVGQTIDWPFPNGRTKTLQVIGVRHRELP